MNFGYVMDTWALKLRDAVHALDDLLESGELNDEQVQAVRYASAKALEASMALIGDVLPDDYPSE